MTSEIEKMYENAEVDYEERYNNCTLNKEGACELKYSCDICKYSEEKYIYPPFTAEKQIELIKWLAKENFVVCKNLGGWYTGIIPTYDESFGITCKKRVTNFSSFTEVF